MTSEFRNILKSIFLTGWSRIYLALTGIFTLYVTTRHLGPNGRGEVAIATTWASTFSTFFYLSLGQVATHRLTMDPRLYRKIAETLFVASILLGLLALLTAALLLHFHGIHYFGQIPKKHLFLGLVSIPFLIWDLYGTSLLAASSQIGKLNRLQVSLRTIHIMILALLSWLGSVTSFSVLLINSSLQIVSSCLMYVLIFDSRLILEFLSLSEFKKFIVDGLKLHSNAIGMFLIGGADLVLLAQHGTNRDVGIYQLSQQVLGILQLIPVAISQVLYGQVTMKGPTQSWKIYRKIVVLTLIAMGIGTLICGLSARLWLPIIAGEQFIDSLNTLYIFLFGFAGFTMSTIMAPQWICRGYFKMASGLTLGLGLLSLTSNWILIPKYGAEGGAYTFLFSYLLSFIINLIWLFVLDKRYEEVREAA